MFVCCFVSRLFEGCFEGLKGISGRMILGGLKDVVGFSEGILKYFSRNDIKVWKVVLIRRTGLGISVEIL